MVVTTDQLRIWAQSLPEVTEKQHHLFKRPVWQVRGKTFLGLGRYGRTVVFCVDEDAANAEAAKDPEHSAAVRRSDARRSFLGLEVQLGSLSPVRAEALVQDAWATHAPPALVQQRLDADGSRGSG